MKWAVREEASRSSRGIVRVKSNTTGVYPMVAK